MQGACKLHPWPALAWQHMRTCAARRTGCPSLTVAALPLPSCLPAGHRLCCRPGGRAGGGAAGAAAAAGGFPPVAAQGGRIVGWQLYLWLGGRAAGAGGQAAEWLVGWAGGPLLALLPWPICAAGSKHPHRIHAPAPSPRQFLPLLAAPWCLAPLPLLCPAAQPLHAAARERGPCSGD